jgi:ATP-binding cassette, subfamily B, bacterial
MKSTPALNQRFVTLRTELATALRVASRVFREAWRVSWWRLVVSGVLSVANDSLPFVSSYLTALAINELTRAVAHQAVDTRLIYGAIIGAVVVMMVVEILREIQLTAEQNLNDLLEIDMATRLNRQYVALDLAQLEGSLFQQLMAKQGGRYQYAYRQLTFSLFRLAGYLSSFVTAAVVIAHLSWWFLPLLLLAVLPAGWVRLQWGRAADRFWGKQGLDRRIQFRTTSLFELPRTSMELRLNGSSSYLLDLVRQLQERHQRGLFALRRGYSRLELATSWIESGVRLGLELNLIGRVLAGRLALGSYTFYTTSFGRFSNAVSSALREFGDISENVLVIRDIHTVLDMKPQLVSAVNARVLPAGLVPRIEFRDVSFTYPGAAEPVFERLSLTIEPGQTVALVGENGAGKSTLIKLLARLYDVDSGAILVDGTDVRELDLPSWRTNLGVLLQDFNQYPFTARENVELGRIEAAGDQRRVKRALQQADAAELVASWPKQLEQPLTKLYDDGLDLSGGQWQRLALARAFFRSAGVLVLDEPTSAVDARAEAQIFEELMAHQEGKTTIIISHRFSTVRRAGRIYVLERGRLIEQGSHAELMRVQGGMYRRLFELQAAGYR